MYTSGRPPWGGRASFVECGLILMGTDDKQRKQASSLPGEICLLLAGVQRGSDTRASHTDMRHESRREPRHRRRLPSFGGCRCNPGGVGRATPERAEGEEHAGATRRTGDRAAIVYAHRVRTCPGVRVSSRRCNACKSAGKGTEGAEEDDRLPLLRTAPSRDPLRIALSQTIDACPPESECLLAKLENHRRATRSAEGKRIGRKWSQSVPTTVLLEITRGIKAQASI